MSRTANAWTCRKCGTEGFDNQRFCRACGTPRLTEPSPVASPEIIEDEPAEAPTLQPPMPPISLLALALIAVVFLALGGAAAVVYEHVSDDADTPPTTELPANTQPTTTVAATTTATVTTTAAPTTTTEASSTIAETTTTVEQTSTLEVTSTVEPPTSVEATSAPTAGDATTVAPAATTVG